MNQLVCPSVAHAPLVVRPHALVGQGSVQHFENFLPRETVGAYLERVGADVPAGPVYAWHNDTLIPQHLWRRLIPRPGDQIVIRAMRPQGGGGGGGKVTRTVATIAVIALSIMAPYAAPAAWGATATVGGVTSITMTGALLSAGVMIAGSFIVSPLVPEPVQ